MTAANGFAPAQIPSGARPFEVMMAHLGVRETLPNRGPWVDEVLRFVGLEPDPAKNPKAPPGGYAWCCAALVWCAHRGGVTLPKVARVAELWTWAQGSGRRIISPEPGCAFVHLQPGGERGHTGFVLHVSQAGTVVHTVSANTNALGSRNGDRVGLIAHPIEYFERDGGGFFHMRPANDGGHVA